MFHVENQFLCVRSTSLIHMLTAYSISNTGKNGPVQNQIARALVDRIIRAARANERFKVVVRTVTTLGFPVPDCPGSR